MRILGHQFVAFWVVLVVLDVAAANILHNLGHNSRKKHIGGRFRLGGRVSSTADCCSELQLLLPSDDPIALLVSRSTASKEVSEASTGDNGGPKLWPPWPFSLLTRRSSSDRPLTTSSLADGSEKEKEYKSTLQLLWYYGRESVRVGVKNLQVVGSQLWFHLPPGAPPFVLLASIPRRHEVLASVAGEATTKTVIPLFANPFARNIALSGLGLAILSWGHYELNRKRKQTPLPLAEVYRDVNRAILPPFLPEAAPVQVMDVMEDTKLAEEAIEDDDDDEKSDEEIKENGSNKLPPQLHKHWNSIVEKAPKPGSFQATWREWKRRRILRKRERQNARRLAIYDELLALQSLKKKVQARRRKTNRIKQTDKEERDPLGYALVTGASRGIGRAIAVELARWEIPLILVARDVERLIALAYDLETCYGIKCCVLAADLSKPGTAANIYRTTSEAGLKVDILVNNAGFSSQGLSVDLPAEEVNNMINVNAVSVSQLTHLYGKEMKERRRGRIMMVSSICGAIAGLPTVAVYAATKAFESTLGLSMAKEMEPYGVGVTVVMPGAVRDTDFKTRSKSDEALCWKLPFYPKTPHEIANWSVHALLRGDTECTMGWQNRFFLKVIKPALPQRLHNLVAEIAWSPLQLPFGRQAKESEPEPIPPPTESEKTSLPASPSSPTTAMRPWYDSEKAPRLLKMEGSAPVGEPPATKPHETDANEEAHPIEQQNDAVDQLNAAPEDLKAAAPNATKTTETEESTASQSKSPPEKPDRNPISSAMSQGDARSSTSSSTRQPSTHRKPRSR